MSNEKGKSQKTICLSDIRKHNIFLFLKTCDTLPISLIWLICDKLEIAQDINIHFSMLSKLGCREGSIFNWRFYKLSYYWL